TCLNGACLGAGHRYDGLSRYRPAPHPAPTQPAPQPRPSAPAQAPRQQFAPRAGGAAAPAGR
ncbi:MAG: hypothetical protein ABFD65_01430, partial [Candidatus Polarisedimenticolia bacterium]